MPPESQQKARYEARGVSTSKSQVHDVVDNLDQGLFPGAFCKITDDFLTQDPSKCNIIHSDGSGTKSVLAYLHYKETGDASLFKGIAQDSIVMNLDDLLCVGVTQNIVISSTLNRNANNVGGEVIKALIEGSEEFLEKLRKFGINIRSGGGETADVGDLTGSILVDSCTTAVADRSSIINASNIKPGLTIVGLASFGKATYEDFENSGIGSNGLTSARHDLLSSYYKERYPETFDKTIPEGLVYSGAYLLNDQLPDSKLTVGQALLSPTRTYLPVINQLLKEFPNKIHSLIHCSGGGQKKCKRFGKNVHFIKDNMLPIPSVFKEIQKASGTTWKEMYQVYNMGHRMEIYCEPSDASSIIKTVKSFNIDASAIGHTEKSTHPEGENQLTIKHSNDLLTY